MNGLLQKSLYINLPSAQLWFAAFTWRHWTELAPAAEFTTISETNTGVCPERSRLLTLGQSEIKSRHSRPPVVTEFCCHFFMLNFKLLFNWFRAKISLSCKVFILQTTVLTGLSTREFRTYNLWQISSIIEICLGFQKSNNTWAHLSLWTSCCCKDETSPLFTG